MRPWTSLVVAAVLALGLSAGAAHAVDEGKLKNLSAPPPVTAASLPADARAVRFAKLVVQLKPEPPIDEALKTLNVTAPAESAIQQAKP